MSLAATTLPAVFTNPISRDNSIMINGSIFGNLYQGTGINETTAEADFKRRFISSLNESTPIIDPEDLVENEGNRVPGTCEWFLDSSQFDLWSSTMVSSILWAPGRPGVGKTFMCVYLIKTLQTRFPHTPQTYLLSFFCKNDDSRKNTAMAVIRSFLRQILQYHPDFLEVCLTDYMPFKDVNAVLQNKDALWQVFHRMYLKSGVETVFCVLDALDECVEDRDWLVKKLVSLKTGNGPTFKLLLTSRGLSESTKILLEPCGLINLNPETNKHVEADLNAFINTSLDVLFRQKRYSSDVEEKTRHSLNQGAGGTFLWVSCALKMLRDSPASEVEETIRTLPRELNGHYTRMLSLIDRDKHSMCADILKWVAAARRPLTLEELAVATNVTSSWGIDPVQKMKDRVECCAGLLKVLGGEVHFIHETANAYLTHQPSEIDILQNSFHVSLQQANLDLSLICIKYLQQGSLDEGEFDLSEFDQSIGETSRKKRFPLLAYCVRYWPLHAQQASPRVEGLQDALEQWSRTNPRSWHIWLKTYWKSEQRGWDIPKKFSLLHLSSFFGIDRLMLIILSEQNRKSKRQLRASLEERSIYDMTALHWAAGNGYAECVELLLDHGANISPRSEFFTPLCWAVRNGHTEVAKVLLQRGASLEQKSWGITPLCWAAWAGKEDIVQLFLSKPLYLNEHMISASTQALDLYHQSTRKESELRWLSLNEARQVNFAAEQAEAQGDARSARFLFVMVVLVGITNLLCGLFYADLIYQACVVQAQDIDWLATRHGTRYGQDVSWAVLTPKGRLRLLRDILLQPQISIAVMGNTIRGSPFKSLLTCFMLFASLGYAHTNSATKFACYLIAFQLAENSVIFFINYLGRIEVPAYVFIIQGCGIFLNPLPGISNLAWRVCSAIWGVLICFIYWIGCQKMAMAASAVPVLVWSIGSIIIGQQAGDVAGDTPLHLAAGRGHAGCVRLLLAHNHSQFTKNRDGRTAVQLALRYDHLECVQLMLEAAAARIFVYVAGVPLYHLAAICGEVEVMTYLDARGLATELSSTGLSPADYAACIDGTEVLDYLKRLNKIEIPQGRTTTLLHRAARNGKLNSCSFLLGCGFPVNVLGFNEETPLHLAAAEACVDTVELLLEAGADIQSVNRTGCTALHLASYRGSKEVCELLILKGAGLDVGDEEGNTPLILAAAYGRTEHVELLLAYGADSDLKSENGFSALGVAVQNDHLKCTDQLLLHGGEVNERYVDGDTILHYAVYRHNHDIVERILKAGGNPNLQNAFKQTPFDWASRYPILAEIFEQHSCTLKLTSWLDIKAALIHKVVDTVTGLPGKTFSNRDFARLIFLLSQLGWWRETESAWRWMKQRDPASTWIYCSDCVKALVDADIFMCDLCHHAIFCNSCMQKHREQSLTVFSCQNHNFHHISATAIDEELQSDEGIMRLHQNQWLISLVDMCNNELGLMHSLDDIEDQKL